MCYIPQNWGPTLPILCSDTNLDILCGMWTNDSFQLVRKCTTATWYLHVREKGSQATKSEKGTNDERKNFFSGLLQAWDKEKNCQMLDLRILGSDAKPWSQRHSTVN